MNPYLAVILDNLIQIAVFIILPVVATLAWKGLTLLEARWGVNLDHQTEHMLDELLRNAVIRAGEWARGQTKLDPANTPDGAAKMAAALEFAKEELERHGYTALAEDRIKRMLEAALGKARVELEPVTPPQAP